MKENNDPCIGIGGAPTRCSTLPEDAAERKRHPIATGFLDYFPDAIAAISELSFIGNQQHNPGQPLHWARGKSSDEDDTAMRHFMQRGTRDKDGVRHSVKAAWRMLAFLQKEIESERASTREEINEFTQNLLAELKAEALDDHNAERIEHELAQQVKDDHGHTHHVIRQDAKMGAEPVEGSFNPATNSYFIRGRWISWAAIRAAQGDSNTPDDRYNS